MKSVKILGIEYEIEYVETVDRHDLKEGEIDYYNQVIRIANWLSPERKQIVLIHEILHGIAEGLRIEDTLNEDTVSMLGRAIHSVLVDSRLNLQLISSFCSVSEKEQSQQLS